MKHNIIISALAFISGFTGTVSAHTSESLKKGMRLPCRISSRWGLQDYDFIEKNQALWSKGLKKKTVKAVLAMAHEDKWPKGFATYEQRSANETNMKYLTMYAIARFSSTDGRETYIVEVPAEENAMLPIGLRPEATFYMSFSASSLDLTRAYSMGTDGRPDQYYSPDEFYPGKEVSCIITNQYEIEPDYDLTMVPEWKKYVSENNQQDVIDNIETYMWPEELQFADDREKYKDFFPYYYAYAISKFTEGGKTRYIIKISASENYHMPIDLEPDNDFYLVVNEDGLDLTRGYNEDEDGSPDDLTLPDSDTKEVTPAPAEEVVTAEVELNAGDKIPCRIVDRGELYSTPSIEDKKDQIEKYLSGSMLEDAISYCSEESWPDGISSLDQRNANEDYFKYFKTYAVAKLDDGRYVLWVPKSENGHMPESMHLDHDIFFVYGAVGLSFDRGYDPAIDGSVDMKKK
jgi:hypothetical protein